MPERELIDTGSDKRYVRRDERGRFTSDQVDVGRSSAADRRRKPRTSRRGATATEGTGRIRPVTPPAVRRARRA
jgi:hypothetical protein